MAIGRSRYAPPYVGGTKGHSVLKQRSYGLSSRAAPPVPSRASSALYSTRAEEHLLADRVSNVNYLSNTLMDEGYDTALRSRGRDQQLLKEATNAIVSSESYATPQTSVASRRVARGQSLVPRAASVPTRTPKQEVESTTPSPPQAQRRPIVVLPPKGARGGDRATSVPPVVIFREEPRQQAPVVSAVSRESVRRTRATSVPPVAVAAPARPSPYRPPVTPTQQAREPLATASLRAHRVPRRFLTRTGYSQYYSAPENVGRVPYILPPPRPAPMKESLRDFPKVYVPTEGQRPSNRAKAAIIASKMEPDPIKRRRPRSEYAANKYREIRREKLESPSGGAAASGGSDRRRR